MWDESFHNFARQEARRAGENTSALWTNDSRGYGAKLEQLQKEAEEEEEAAKSQNVRSGAVAVVKAFSSVNVLRARTSTSSERHI